MKKSCFNYKPSYIYSHGSKYKDLTNEYEDLFLDFIINGKKTDNFYYGIKEISKYIESSFYYGINQKYDTKTPQEKVIYAIYYRYVKYIGNERAALSIIKDKISDEAENSVFYSLGIETYKKRNFKYNSGNFIKHTIKNVFIVLLLNIFKSFEYEMNIGFNMLKENESNIESKDLIDLFQYIPKDNKDRLFDYLEGDIKIDKLTEDDISYLKKIHERMI